ncbi:MAG TPA: O-antigen ligase family protein [Burkholderiaceae bacterium]|nr:O-antigen ligase family protein [Burkholderiaceae bacterium]
MPAGPLIRWRDDTIRLLIFLLLPASVLASRTGGIVFWLLALLGLACLASDLLSGRRSNGQAGRRSEALGWPQSRWLWGAALLPVLLNVSSVLWFDLPAREIGWWAFLMAPAIAAVAIRVPDSATWLLRGALFACFVALAAAAYSRFVLREVQPTFVMNPLPFGLVGFVAATLSAWAVAITPRGSWLRWLFVAAVVSGAMAYVASGIRGGLLALPLFVAAFAHWGEPRSVRARVPWVGAAVLVAVIGSTAFVFQPRNAMTSKLERIGVEVEDFAQGRTQFSNVGERLAMWRASVEMVKAHPLFGIGSHQFANASRELRDKGLYPTDAHIYRHAHSAYVTVAAEYGLMGLLAMAAAIFCAIRAVAGADPHYRTPGFALLGIWLLFGITNDVLSHQLIIRSMIAAIVILVFCRPGRAVG